MLNQLRFYWSHTLNDLKTNGQRTLFALLCIAAGVSAIVSLQTLAGMIQNTLTNNLQESNRGDLRISVINANDNNRPILEAAQAEGLLIANELAFAGFNGAQYVLTAQGYTTIEAWFQENYGEDVALTYRQPVASPIGIITASGVGVLLDAPTQGTTATGVTPVMIEAARYPFYSTIVSFEGKPLAEMLKAPYDIVLGVTVAETLNVGVGDSVVIQGVEGSFVVRGIVPTEAEVRNPTQDFLAALNGFYLLDVRSRELFPNLDQQASVVYGQISPSLDVEAVEKAIQAAFPFTNVTTTEDLRATFERVSQNVNQLVTVMGLISLLLGSVGIINTMQVIVSRRVQEIAVLKTLGLQANQITLLFLFQAFVMGVAGSFGGVLLGWVMVFVIKGVAEGLLGQPLPFIFSERAVVSGVVVGTLVTTIFGFLPTLSAGQVRPALVLRPTDNPLPQAGRWSILAALAVMAIALAGVASGLLGSVPLALGVIVGAFLVAGLLYLLLVTLIWLVGRFFPSFGWVDLKLSLREMLVTRNRGATTLLALVVGVFSLSLITLLANAVAESLDDVLLTGDNVFIQVGGGEAGLALVEEELAKLQGEVSYRVNRSYNMRIVGIKRADGTLLSRDDINALLQASDPFLQFASTPSPEDADAQRQLSGRRNRRLQEFSSTYGSVDALTLERVPYDRPLVAGKHLTASDANGIVIQQGTQLDGLDIQVGDAFIYEYSYGGFLGIGATTGQLELVIRGIAPEPQTIDFASSFVYALREAFPAELPPSQIRMTATIPQSDIAPLRRALTQYPQTFLLEIESLNRIFRVLLDQFTAFPLLVALLGLFVGGIVIANSVALATMERRREIAIMKALGLQRERVLGMLLIENSLLGFVGGVIGVGMGIVGLLVLLNGAENLNISVLGALALMALCVMVALVAAMASAWGASGEKPLNVLRYE